MKASDVIHYFVLTHRPDIANALVNPELALDKSSPRYEDVLAIQRIFLEDAVLILHEIDPIKFPNSYSELLLLPWDHRVGIVLEFVFEKMTKDIESSFNPIQWIHCKLSVFWQRLFFMAMGLIKDPRTNLRLLALFKVLIQDIELSPFK